VKTLEKSRISLGVVGWLILAIGQVTAAQAGSHPEISGKTVRLAKQSGAAATALGIPAVQCAFLKMGRAVEFVDVPWTRAQQGTRRGSYDGFFMASRTANRDSYAIASVPFVKNDWVYVIAPGSDLTPSSARFLKQRFGANQGTARIQWLLRMRQDGKLAIDVSDAPKVEHAWEMLARGRFDVLLENRANLEKFLSQKKYAEFRFFPARQAELSVYFSKVFLARDPMILESFNDAIGHCRASRIED